MSPRILVVDDDATIRRTLAEALGEDDDADVTVASSGEHAIRIVNEQGAPDLVLSDIRMQGLNGLDLLRVLRRRAPSAKVVLMTAYHDVGTAVGAMREGAADFLCKPFDLHALRAVLERLLNGGAATSETAAIRYDAASGALPGAAWREQRAGDPESDRGPEPAERAVLAGRYEIEREVGRGAMATVHRAHDRRHDRAVAVKVLRRDLSSVIGVDRFLGEIRIAARLQHPHVLTLIDSGRWDGSPFFVMPFIAGPSLRQRLVDDGPLPFAEAARLLRDVADALAAAHALGIVHRDVKPENVLLSGRHGWVADFGVARALWGAAEAGGTLTGAVIGTPLYMAPEQAYGDGGVDGRADIYSLGVVAYELLCGAPPFTGRSTREVLAAHLVKEPPPLRGRRSAVPPALEEVILQCLSKDPAQRWPDAESLARSFAGFAVEGSH